MNARIEEAQLLSRAIAVEDKHISKLATQLESIGGLRALFWSGAEVFDSVLSSADIERIENLVLVVEKMLAPPPLTAIVDDASAVADFFQARLGHRRTESFWVLFLDARGHPLGCECVAEGTLTACLVHPREVFGPAIRARAAQIVLVHNHPSGDPRPSREDLDLTERMTEVGVLMGIPVVDHVIVASGGFRSLGGGGDT